MISLEQKVLPRIYHHDHDTLMLIIYLYLYLYNDYKQANNNSIRRAWFVALPTCRDGVPRSGVPIVKSRLV